VSEQQLEHEQRVTPLELFFDLVFVFGFTQVTTLLSHDPSWGGLGRGLLILALLWWAWSGYAWFTNTVDPDAGAVRAAMLVATGAMFVASLAVPEAFDRHGLVFALGFAIVSGMHLALYAVASKGDLDLMAAVGRLSVGSVAGTALLVGGAFVEADQRTGVWAAAIVVSFGAPLLVGVSGWRLEPRHFAERHELVVIIALGESLVAIGVGAAGTDLGASVITAAVLGLVVATALWFAYFDFFAIRGPQMLADRTGAERIALARDTYTYLHLPMIIGIVLFAFAMKTTLAHTGDELDVVPAVGLCGGPALFLLAFALIRVRVQRRLSRGRLVAGGVCVALLPAALAVRALVALALIATVWVLLHAYELFRWREDRARTRALRARAS
jgi:low temperature requirement protein LtrA